MDNESRTVSTLNLLTFNEDYVNLKERLCVFTSAREVKGIVVWKDFLIPAGDVLKQTNVGKVRTVRSHSIFTCFSTAGKLDVTPGYFHINSDKVNTECISRIYISCKHINDVMSSNVEFARQSL